MAGKGPSALWYGTSTALMLVVLIVIAIAGVFWPILVLTPFAAIGVGVTVRAARRGNLWVRTVGCPSVRQDTLSPIRLVLDGRFY